MIRLLLDQGIPRRVAARLRATGIDAHHVGELGLSRARDLEILDVAEARAASVVTFDGDFPRLLAVLGRRRPSVIHLRGEGLDTDRTFALLEWLLPRIEEDLAAGCVVSVIGENARVRRLPLIA